MRKVLSIPLALLILFSGLTVNIATHYCCGMPVETMVSLSGELATCGMEQVKTITSSQEVFTNHCCENVVSSRTFNNNFIPSFYFLNNPDFQIIDAAYLPFENSALNSGFKFFSSEIIRPPGTNTLFQSKQESLCIFRI